jgi:hypothetical protein
VQLESSSAKTGITPGQQNKTNPLFEDRCNECLGVYYSKMVPDPDIKTTIKDRRMRRLCVICGVKTDYYCFGCHRFLCLSPPTKSTKSKIESKQPKYFSIDTPILDKDGELQMSKNGVIQTVTEFGMWTCYHSAHQTPWRTYIELNRNKLMSAGTNKRACRNYI